MLYFSHLLEARIALLILMVYKLISDCDSRMGIFLKIIENEINSVSPIEFF